MTNKLFTYTHFLTCTSRITLSLPKLPHPPVIVSSLLTI